MPHLSPILWTMLYIIIMLVSQSQIIMLESYNPTCKI